MYVSAFQNQSEFLTPARLAALKFRSLSPMCIWKVGETVAPPFWGRLRRLLVRHSFSTSEVLGLLWHVIVVNVERHMLPQLSLSRNLRSCERILLSIAP